MKFLRLLCLLWPLLPGSLSARESEIRHLSRTGPEDAVNWEFLCTGGRISATWTTIPVPSCWEQQDFGTYNYGMNHRPGRDRPNPPPLADEEGHYRHTFRVPVEWRDRAVRIVFDGVMTDAEVKINGQPAGPVTAAVTDLTGHAPFFGLGKPRDGVNGLLDLPDASLSLLAIIPAMRNKFHNPDQLGPQSLTPTTKGGYSGAVVFRFSPP